MKNDRSFGSNIPARPLQNQPCKSKTGLREALTNFLVDASSHAENLVCPHCGKKMEYVTTTVSLYGSETSWQIKLPVCSCAQPSALPPAIPTHRAIS